MKACILQETGQVTVRLELEENLIESLLIRQGGYILPFFDQVFKRLIHDCSLLHLQDL